MKDKKSIFAWPLENWHLALLVIGLLFAFGIYAFRQMPKAEFPEITIRQGVVVAVYPGATTEEVEEQVARPLERYLFTYKEVNRTKTTSTCKNGMCIVMVELTDATKDKDAAWSKIRHGLNTFKSQLPSGVVAIAVNDNFGDASALLITLESQQRSYRELQDYADHLSDRLRAVPEVSNVRIYGNLQEQLTVHIDRQRLASYGIGQSKILSALSAANMQTIAGSVDTRAQQVPIHVRPGLNQSEEDLRNLIVFTSADGRVVRLRDVATVTRGYDLSDAYIQNNGNPCVLLSLEMTPGHNIVAYGRQVEQIIRQFQKEELPEDVHIERIADQPRVVQESVQDFLVNLLESMAIIILVMMILFPFRTALVASVTIPLSTFISVAIMYMCGIPLNTVTLAALIVALGMIVDNSIVVLDGYQEYLLRDMSRKDAAIESVRQYFMPMLLATACISILFFPLLFTITGEGYDFIHNFPATLAINLMVSLLVAVMVIPFMETRIIRPKDIQKKNENKKSITDYVQDFYDRVLGWTFRNPWLTISGGILTIVLSVVLCMPFIKIRMFPTADRNQFAVEVYLPEGKGLHDTEVITDSVVRMLRQDERVTGITTFMGCSSPRFQMAYAPQFGGPNFAQLIVTTSSNRATDELLDKYAPTCEAFPGAYVRFKQLDFNIATPQEFRFYGDDLDSLHAVEEELEAYLRTRSDLTHIHSDYEQPAPIVEVTLDPAIASQMGINRSMAQLQLTANTQSITAGQVWEGDYKLPIVVEDTDLLLSDLQNLPMTSLPCGQAVPLRQVAHVQAAWNEGQIVHRCGRRCLTVTAEPVRGQSNSDIQADCDKWIQKNLHLPRGVKYELGGEVENTSETLPRIGAGVGIALVIVFFFILFSFRRYKITFVCMAAMLFSIPGLLLGFALYGKPVGITAILGIITLIGMIMRNEILIFEHADDKVDELRKDHPDASIGDLIKQAAYSAGRRRMVPIFLTTATTAIGVVPMILGHSSLWMPVGISILGGGIGALILVVTVLPVVYWKTRKQ